MYYVLLTILAISEAFFISPNILRTFKTSNIYHKIIYNKATLAGDLPFHDHHHQNPRSPEGHSKTPFFITVTISYTYHQNGDLRVLGHHFVPF